MFWEMWELEEIIRQLWMLPDLLLSVLLGFAIGFERKLRFKEAGIRTHTIVCFGAALMMVISKYAFGSDADSARVAAQIVSGVGFLGSLLAFVLSFIPPAQIAVGSNAVWYAVLIIGCIVVTGAPFVIYAMRKPHWVDKDSQFEPFHFEKQQ